MGVISENIKGKGSTFYFTIQLEIVRDNLPKSEAHDKMMLIPEIKEVPDCHKALHIFL